ncbi:probable pancreatic secretory proteinase inhibitor isoform X4 [Esox lucius]|uniref:probable pancreatic secretory proteinase inhibitor isoform X4 n=1 Tax=Esox lucius TaxID=8010 RepID=UPI00097342DD|nr:probable pancreatic secretory proteinase inhibitor isoform X4 [Esox lucius]
MTALGHRGVSDPYIHAEKRDPRGRELYNMAGKLVILLCGMLLVASSGAEQGNRKPSCGSMEEIVACPMNFAPVCGTDGNTYPNECALCVKRQETKMDILVIKEGSC